MFNRLKWNPSKSSGAAPSLVVSENGDRGELTEEARRSGRLNMPASEAATLSDIEAAIIRKRDQDHIDLAERSGAALLEQEAAFARVERRMPTASDFDRVVERANAEVEQDLAVDSTIARSFDHYDRNEGNLRIFVRQNRLDREPKYPDSFIWHLWVLSLVFALESLANAVFFASGNSLGYLGGVLFAAIIAAVNVGGGFFFGWRCLPYLHHVRQGHRRTAGVATALYIAFALLFNLAVAHFRDLYSLANGPRHDALGALLRGPFDLSFNSFLMLSVGLLACLLALWKGYTADDPYPGHGHVHRECVRARRAHDRDKSHVIQQMLSREVAVPVACDELVRVAEGLVEEMSRALVAARRAADGYDAERERISIRCEKHLRVYRHENSAVRRTPPPAYFADFPTLPPAQMDRSPIERMEQRLALAGRTLRELKTHAHEIKSGSAARVVAISHRFDAFLAARLPRHGRPATAGPGATGRALAMGGEQA